MVYATIQVKIQILAIQIPTPMSGSISARYIHVIGPYDNPNPKKKIPINAIFHQGCYSKQQICNPQIKIRAKIVIMLPVIISVFLPTFSISI